MVLVTEQLTDPPEVLALRTAIAAALTEANAVPLTLQEIKALADLPPYYTEVAVSLRYGPPSRASGHLGVYGFRIDTRVVSAIEETANSVLQDIDGRLRYARMDVGGVLTTPVQHESSDAVADDDGFWSALWTWTTTLKNRRTP